MSEENTEVKTEGTEEVKVEETATPVEGGETPEVKVEETPAA